MNDDLSPETAERYARAVVSTALEAYAAKRETAYAKMTLRKLLSKDILMITLRGVSTSKELVSHLFTAFESSSEETHMGETAQQIAIGLARDAVDLGDMVLERERTLWVAEVKSQTNTVNARSRPQILRVLKGRVAAAERIRASHRRDVRAMIGVLRGNPRDAEMTFTARDTADKDIDGFPYRYLVGTPFWLWLTNRPSIFSLVGEIEDLSTRISAARDEAIARLQIDMDEWLGQFGSERTPGAVLRLIDQGKKPTTKRKKRGTT